MSKVIVEATSCPERSGTCWEVSDNGMHGSRPRWCCSKEEQRNNEHCVSGGVGSVAGGAQPANRAASRHGASDPTSRSSGMRLEST
jgi:hypothetical protein